MQFLCSRSTQFACAVLFLALAVHFFRNYYLAGSQCESSARLDGRTVLITGASRGVGLETAVELARRGARLIIACRSDNLGHAAVAEVLRRSGRDLEHPIPVAFYPLNLASLSSIRAFADRILREEKRLDILINNAGGMHLHFSETEDGFETTWQVNYLGHFLLTKLLMNFLKGSAGHARIIHVSSMAHRWASIDWEAQEPLKSRGHDAQLQAARYSMGPVYWQSKLANVLFSSELAIRLRGSEITSNSVHPGTVHTAFYQALPTFIQPLSRLFFMLFFKTAVEGSQSIVCAAVNPAFAMVSGEYMAECAVQLPSEVARNLSAARQLWRLSEQQLGIQFNP